MTHNGVSMAALERAVSVINRILSKAQGSSAKDVAARNKKNGKWVKFTVKGSGKAAVRERRAAGRSVANYLALPVEEYSLLDPSWIKREPGSDIFCLSAPLRGITGVDLEPTIWVSVVSDPDSKSVSFSSERASLGDATWDEKFSLSFSSSLTYVGAGASSQSANASNGPGEEQSLAEAESGHSRHDDVFSSTVTYSDSGSVNESDCVESSEGSSIAAEEHKRGEEESDTLKEPPGSSRAAEGRSQALVAASTRTTKSLAAPGHSGHLQARAQIVANVRLGPPLTVVPGFLLSYTGGLVATAVLQALMPTLLELLGRDYERWADGQARRSTGSESNSLVAGQL